MSEADFILFDLGGVLVNVDHVRAERAWITAGFTDCSLVEAMVGSGAKAAGDRGEVTEDGMQDLVTAFSGKELTKAQLRTLWGAVVSWRAFVPDMLARLRVPYGVLSNIDPIHAAVLEPLTGAHPVIYSFDIGNVKPSPAVFEHAVKRCGVAASRIRYVDDRAENVDAAIRAGMQGRRATGWEDLQVTLAGLLGPSTGGVVEF